MAEDKKTMEDQLNLSKQLERSLKKQRGLQGQINLGKAEQVDLFEKQIDIEKKFQKFAKENAQFLEDGLESAGDLGKTIENSIKGIPLIGSTLVDKFQLKDLGEQFQNLFADTLKGGIAPIGKFLMGPAGIAAAFAGILLAIRAIRKASFDLSEDLGVSREEARDLLPELKGSQMAFDAIGMDGSKIQSTLKEIGSEFGSLENMTVANARNIEMFAQNAGVAGTEIVKFNKVMMDLTGSSFDVATNMAKTAVNMAKSANVSTSKVLSDMASSANKFAEFSMQGAEGFAKAAVEAAKVGSSVNEILGAADKLLDFESSITAQFKAQVLTGKQINTERARQLALDGDIAGLTNEIQSIVGQVGDIQTLNVIQRQSVAEAIGISVQDLLRISRGEQAQQQETVQDKVDTTNKILLEGLDVDKKILEATEDKNVNIIQPAF
mgnify:CR=1 FL=1